MARKKELVKVKLLETIFFNNRRYREGVVLMIDKALVSSRSMEIIDDQSVKVTKEEKLIDPEQHEPVALSQMQAKSEETEKPKKGYSKEEPTGNQEVI
jgi:hypothetical protein